MSVAAGLRASAAARFWLVAGAAGFLLLPWYMLPDGASAWPPARLVDDAQAASGLAQGLRFGRWWLLAAALGLLVCAAGAAVRTRKRQGDLLAAGGGLGFAVVVAAGLLVGARGWSARWAEAAFGEIGITQHGLGWGGALVLVSLLMLAGIGLARRGRFGGDAFVACAVVGASAALALFIGYPIGKALAAAPVDDDGLWSLAALVERVGGERVWGLGCLAGALRCGAAWNTLALALASASLTTVLGTLIALGAERGRRRRNPMLQVLALLPVITPPFVVGLGLILLFGRAGVVNRLLEAGFGVEPTRWFYGLPGVLLAQVFAFTPIAFMIMRGVVQGVSPALEEAAQTLGADRRRAFLTVTLPLLEPGLLNAFLVGFIESIADFGNPIVVGGQYAVLSTEIFFAIVGAQYDQGRAAALALILMSFALGAFALQRVLLGRQDYTTVGGKGAGGAPMPLPEGVRRLIRFVAWPWLAFTALVYVFAFSGGFVRNWGRDYTPTLAHFRTAFSVERGEFGLVWSGTAWHSLFTTVKLAAIAAPFTAALGLLIAYLLARTRFRGQAGFEFSALLAFAIPGTVLGVSYVMAFNVPPLELTGTGLVIVLCFLFRNLPVGVRAGAAALRQIDRSLDEASAMLRASTARTLRHVTLPLLRPAIAAALVYSFVRAMTTVSAVIFLVTAENELATTYIIGRVGNSDYGIALAYCTVLMLLMSAVTGLIQFAVGERQLGRARAPAIQEATA